MKMINVEGKAVREGLGHGRSLRNWAGGIGLAGLLGLVSACSGNSGSANTPPVAVAGADQAIKLGETAVFAGGCSDVDPGDGPGLSYRWQFKSLPTSSALKAVDLHGFDGPGAFFVPDLVGNYSLELQCTDRAGATSAPDTIAVAVEPRPNLPPLVEAGRDGRLLLGDKLQLQGSAADPEGNALTLQWQLSASPTGSSVGDGQITGATTLEPSLTPDLPGTWSFTLVATDSEGASSSDSLSVELVPADPFAGSLALQVLDAASLQPVAGVEVWVEGKALASTTDQDGKLVVQASGLAAPFSITLKDPATVLWDHDADSSTTPILAPLHQMLSVAQVSQSSLEVALPRTEAGERPTGSGSVAATLPASFFDRLPTIRPFFSLAGSRISGQLRVVVVAPLLPAGGLTRLSPSAFLAPALSPRVPLPGNMATDDRFLDQNAALFDRPPLPDGSPPFTHLELQLPAGPARFFVMAGLATIDMNRLLPLLVSGAGEGALGPELGIVMGAIDLDTAMVGVFDAEVPAVGSLDLSSKFEDPEAWPAFQRLNLQEALEVETLCDANGSCVSLERVRLLGGQAVEIKGGPSLADPRLAAALPNTAPFETFCAGASGGVPSHCDPPQFAELPVPADTHTELAYELRLAALRFPAGHPLAPAGASALIGYRFARAPLLDEAMTRFHVPTLEGGLAGAELVASSTQLRRASAREMDGAFLYQPGERSQVFSRLSAGSMVESGAGKVFESLPALNPAGAALQTEVLFDVEDASVSPPLVRSAWATIRGAGNASTGPLLPAAFTATAMPGAEASSLSVSKIDRSVAGADGIPQRLTLWELRYPADQSQLDLPSLPAGVAPFASGEEVQLRLSEWRFDGAFSYPIATARRWARNRSASSSDSFAFKAP